MIREEIPLLSPEKVVVSTPIHVSPAAVAKLREVIASKDLGEGAGLRVFVSGGGCSGLQYGMAFETEGGDAEDVTFEASGLKVFVDPVSIQYLEGANIDFVDSLMGGGFKIENPQAASSCGCGTSFKPKGEEGAQAQGQAQGQAQAGGCGSEAQGQAQGGGCGCG